MKSLSTAIPIFPLSGALLLPSGNLPLNIFEPRYISMVNYALANDKLIGMIQPKNNDTKDLYKTGCVGKITTYSETDDSRYIINLNGLLKFEIKNEINHEENFRLFNVEYEKNENHFEEFDKNSFDKKNFLQKIKFFFKKKGLAANLESIEEINEKSLIVMAAMVSPFTNNEKQMLLECKNINSLANTVISLFDFEIKRFNENETIN